MKLKPGSYSDSQNNVFELMHLAYHNETKEEYAVYRLAKDSNKIWVMPSNQFLETIGFDLQGDEIVESSGSSADLQDAENDIEGTTLKESHSNSATINQGSHSSKKVELFKSLFRGRNDVYAKRYEGQSGKPGYSPECANEWREGVCQKKRVKCSKCEYRQFLKFDESVIKAHLLGKKVVGLYPMLSDETCYFLVMDFDKETWEKDVAAIRSVCNEIGLDPAVERSRSGNGAHIWFFFSDPISCYLARKFGSTLLTAAMNKRHELSFLSYDRLLPNQDTMPKGGFGNLIALPLQKQAREQGNSVFVDENFTEYSDQWAYLSNIKRLNLENVETLISKLSYDSDLGNLMVVSESIDEPFNRKRDLITVTKDDFPDVVTLIKSNMLYVEKKGISSTGLNFLKRLAVFKNPDFYKSQAMRLSTYDKPRVIYSFEETDRYICLPRGLESAVSETIEKINFIDKTNSGKEIDVQFNGTLREEQKLAIDPFLENDIGVLSATTAFGKTVIGAKLIAERKVNTLILVHRAQLLQQWKERLGEFIIINEVPMEEFTPTGRKRKKEIIGQIGGGRTSRSGVIDVAVMQSLVSGDEVKEFVKDYGMVIVDECHHVSAFSFEKILKTIEAKYVYGLTATPTRQDGHHPIIFMQCGEILYRVDAKKQAAKRSFEHIVIPRFTQFKLPSSDIYNSGITENYRQIMCDSLRNQQIINDVMQNIQEGRNPIILTERTDHVHELAKQLISLGIKNVFTLVGGRSTKKAREILSDLGHIPDTENVVVIATGKYVGEGFDLPRLDTLFLAMPISWKGTVQQYVGRLHRNYEGKSEVRVYDYVDFHVPMFEKMYQKRLKSYAAVGYKTRGDSSLTENCNVIYDSLNFEEVYEVDLLKAKKLIKIVSPYLSEKRVLKVLQALKRCIDAGAEVIVVTRPTSDYRDKDCKKITEYMEVFRTAGISVETKSKMHQKCAIIDSKIVWYGSINLLGYGSSGESIMRLESVGIAMELEGSQ